MEGRKREEGGRKEGRNKHSGRNDGRTWSKCKKEQMRKHKRKVIKKNTKHKKVILKKKGWPANKVEVKKD